VTLHKYGCRGEIVNGTRATITDVDPDAVTVTVHTAGARAHPPAPVVGA
jgi:hypothetical protein